MFDELEKLPREVQESTVKANTAFKRYEKARKQLALWGEEKDNAASAMTLAQEYHANTLNRWNPETNEMQNLEEIK